MINIISLLMNWCNNIKLTSFLYATNTKPRKQPNQQLNLINSYINQLYSIHPSNSNLTYYTSIKSNIKRLLHIYLSKYQVCTTSIYSTIQQQSKYYNWECQNYLDIIKGLQEKTSSPYIEATTSMGFICSASYTTESEGSISYSTLFLVMRYSL